MDSADTTRRSIMLTGKTHQSLTEFTKRMGCTHTEGVAAMLSMLNDETTVDRIVKFISSRKAKQMELRSARQELANKISNLSDEEVSRLMGDLDLRNS